MLPTKRSKTEMYTEAYCELTNLQHTKKVVPTSNTRFKFPVMAWWSVTEHLNKGYKEVVNSFSQLLNVATETNKL